VAAAGLSIPLVSGCAPEESDTDLTDVEALGSEFTSNAIVIAWNDIARNAALANDGFQDFSIDLRGLTMMHLAIHDALNTVLPVFGRYALASLVQPLAHPTAAAAQAGHDVLVNVFPAQKGTFDTQLANQLSQVPNGTGKTLGIQVGKDAAAAIIARRAIDRMSVFGSFTPSNAPGNFQFVPPFNFVFRPAFGDSQPFAINSGGQFRPGGPPNLRASQYTTSYNEVKAFGILSGSSRSADQSQEAQWWFEFAEVGWNRITNLLARQRGVHLYPAARMFALVNMGIMDSYVAVWNAKRFYNRWRPFTAIRSDTDGNNGTAPDPNWQAFCINPPTWEYPSAHAMQSAAAAEMLVSALGTDSVSFTSTSSTAPPGQPNRSFNSLRAAAAEAADSRVMCGIHFRYATDAGLVAGRELANFILGHQLLLLDILPP